MDDGTTTVLLCKPFGLDDFERALASVAPVVDSVDAVDAVNSPDSTNSVG